METREVLKNLREARNLTQDELAERVMVTRQAVSRWETGETQPNTDTLKLLSSTYSNMDDLIDVCIPQMVKQGFSEDQAREYMKQMLPTLDYWKKYEELSDDGEFEAFKEQLIREINDLHIEGMPKVEKPNALVGRFVNLEYPLPGGMKAKFLNDNTTYLGNQLESELGGERCFGVLASMDFILISTYEKEGENPELVLYKKR